LDFSKSRIQVSAISHLKTPKLKLSTFQIGTRAKRNQGLRIGTTRRPPRGVPKSRWKSDGYFDIWLPSVAPSLKLLRWIKQHDINDAKTRKSFFERYERELLADSVARQTVQLLAQIATRTPISIGCFCADESRCHRSRLYLIIEQTAAT
jgi:uncharacterized protein YeaO (DUF488 family)